MTHLLDDCWLLARRAEKQFDGLRAEIIDFFDRDVVDLVIDDDAQTGEKTIYFPQEPRPPREWGADVGQLINNARTALDHLVYALAIEGGGEPQADKTAFPIFEDRDEYLKVRGRGTRKITVRDQYLAGVEERWRKKIDNVQPYQRGKNAYLDPLAVLSDIANSHKHKTLKTARITIETPSHVCFSVGAFTKDLRVRFDPSRNDHIEVETQMQANKALVDPGIVLQPKVDVGGGIAPGLVFGEPPRFYTLSQIKRAVSWSRAVIKWLEPAFDPGI